MSAIINIGSNIRRSIVLILVQDMDFTGSRLDINAHLHRKDKERAGDRLHPARRSRDAEAEKVTTSSIFGQTDSLSSADFKGMIDREGVGKAPDKRDSSSRRVHPEDADDGTKWSIASIMSMKRAKPSPGAAGRAGNELPASGGADAMAI